MTFRSCIARPAENSVAGAPAGNGGGGEIQVMVRKAAAVRTQSAKVEKMV
jgi:hypothetical protein